MTPVLVLTRQPAPAKRFATLVGYDGPVVISPAFRVSAIAAHLDHRPDHVILTSGNGVAQLSRFDLTGANAWCVGARTAALAQAQGLIAIDGGGDADRLIATILAADPKGRFVHLRGRHARGQIARRLGDMGYDVSEAVVYDQQPQPPNAALRACAAGTRPLVFPVFSPRSALILAGLRTRAAIHVAAFSPAVADAVAGLPVETVVTAPRPDLAAMVGTVQNVLDRLSRRTA